MARPIATAGGTSPDDPKDPVSRTADVHAATARLAGDLRGASRLIIDAVTGITDIVEGMHRNIARVSPIVGTVPPGRTRGITGLVYRSVRSITRLVGTGVDAAFARLPMAAGEPALSPRREALLAALNGVLGDHLDATDSPLSIPMRLRRDGRVVRTCDRDALSADIGPASARVLVLAHGLCMNDLQWRRDGHDHGEALARDLDVTSLYLHYNTGRSIAANGREFAALLETLVAAWPVPIEELIIVGHSMGGLVARSACLHAEVEGHAWRRQLGRLVFLGTPHHGAPLERAGNWVDRLVGASPYTSPLARLGGTRSAGIKDLRHGRIGGVKVQRAGAPTRSTLPDGVRVYAVAATRAPQTTPAGSRLPGDGLVPVASALGRHREASRSLPIPPSQQAVCRGMNHFELLGHEQVYAHLLRWLVQKPTKV